MRLVAGAPLPGVRPGDVTFAASQVRIRAPRDPARGWALTQALVARVAAAREARGTGDGDAAPGGGQGDGGPGDGAVGGRQPSAAEKR
jgi:hypothetical protein